MHTLQYKRTNIQRTHIRKDVHTHTLHRNTMHATTIVTNTAITLPGTCLLILTAVNLLGVTKNLTTNTHYMYKCTYNTTRTQTCTIYIQGANRPLLTSCWPSSVDFPTSASKSFPMIYKAYITQQHKVFALNQSSRQHIIINLLHCVHQWLPPIQNVPLLAVEL